MPPQVLLDCLTEPEEDGRASLTMLTRFSSSSEEEVTDWRTAFTGLDAKIFAELQQGVCKWFGPKIWSFSEPKVPRAPILGALHRHGKGQSQCPLGSRGRRGPRGSHMASWPLASRGPPA